MLQLCDLSDHIADIEQPIRDIGEQADLPRLFEDIAEALENRQAFLFMEGTTFTVLKPIVQQGQRKLLVWACYSEKTWALKNHLPQIKQIAKEIEASALQFWTNIPLLQRYYPRLGATFVSKSNQFEIWEITL